MATKKKVAGKTIKKAAPAKKAVAKKVAAPKKAAAKAAPVKKKPAAAPKKAAAKKPAAKVVKPAPKKAAAKKAAVKASPSKKVAPAKKPAVVAKKAAPVVKKAAVKAAPAAKKAVVAKAPVKKLVKAVTVKAVPVPAPKSKKAPATKTVVAENGPIIAKPVEKVDIMAKSKQEKSEKEPVKKAKAEEPAKRVAERPSGKTTSRSAGSSRSSAKAVAYVPEFTKSVLDQPDAPAGPTYRYSDPELLEFKEIILKKLEAAKKELVFLQGLITRKDEAGTDDTENKYMSMEDGSGSQEREQLNQMASRQIQFIDHLEKALVRIENKSYGICRETGKLIEKARLKAVPHATLSIEAKLAKSK
ncbi:TraR/DksA family transcriptional regulator [Chitinophaga deserti]|uniref:TraR/DksA family transcriptional regulator n=1 Tax=Chitinophaga deserti TaxID=2164099 RepID=UPI000D6A9291|nr:TraR/DksA C4-type zinc finger protein [Chitinophaga deserti]